MFLRSAPARHQDQHTTFFVWTNEMNILFSDCRKYKQRITQKCSWLTSSASQASMKLRFKCWGLNTAGKTLNYEVYFISPLLDPNLVNRNQWWLPPGYNWQSLTNTWSYGPCRLEWHDLTSINKLTSPFLISLSWPTDWYPPCHWCQFYLLAWELIYMFESWEWRCEVITLIKLNTPPFIITLLTDQRRYFSVNFI